MVTEVTMTATTNTGMIATVDAKTMTNMSDITLLEMDVSDL